MIRIPDSSTIASIDYDDGCLIVEFHNGGKYRYNDVPVSKFADMINSISKGRYLAAEIKGKYEFAKVS